MDYAIIKVPAAPVRKKARHQSEMVNQLLFGEAVKVIKEKGELWVKVRSLHDDYEGWVTNNLLQEVKEKEAGQSAEFVTTDFFQTIQVKGMDMQIPFGSSLRGLIAGRGTLDGFVYDFDGSAVNRAEQQLSEELIKELAMPWLNAPYMWGGRTIFGIDCSGFVQLIFKTMGIDLPRDAWQQAQQGKTVKKLKDAVCGDLAFFDDKEEIVHVGILLNNEQIIHASGKVRIDTIDKKGIIQADTGKRTHSLRAIRAIKNR
jgi:cell wall-associated NlpC family hydrolase